MPGGLQEWIHKLEVGEGTRWIRLGTLGLVLLALTAVYHARQYRNFSTVEAMDSAQLARNLAQGRGFTTQFIRPFSMYLQEQHGDEHSPRIKGPHPDISNAPLYPLALAAVLKVVPVRYDLSGEQHFERFQAEVVIALFNQALFFLAMALVFLLARRLFDSPVAWLSVVLFAAADVFWRFTVSGQSTMLLLVLLLALVWVLVDLEQGLRDETRAQGWFLRRAVLAGGLLALGGLTRYAFVTLLFPLLAFFAFYFGPRRRAVMATAGLTCLLIMAPWLVRNYQLSGSPFGTAWYSMYAESETFPANSLERSLGTDLKLETDLAATKIDRVEGRELLRKLLTNLNQVVQTDLPRLGGSWVTAFFLVGLLVPFSNPTLGRLRVFLVLALAVWAVVQSLGHTHLATDSPVFNSENLLVLLAPLVFIFGVGLYYTLLDQLPVPFPEARHAVTAGFGLLGCLPLVFTLLPPKPYPVAYPPYYPPMIQQLTDWMKADELTMTDMPWATAWYGNRPGVWLTLNPGSDFSAINDYLAPIHALHLTQVTLDRRLETQILKGYDRGWGTFFLQMSLTKEVPAKFPLQFAYAEILPAGQLYLTDRPRWQLPAR